MRQRTPVIQGFGRPGPVTICPDVFELFFQDHYGIDRFIERQQLFEVLPLLLSLEVFTVFQQQVLAAFVDGFILFAGFVIFAVSHLVDDAVKIGNHVE